MKLIIDIKDNYKSLITSAWSYGVAPSMTVLEDISKAVMKGISLDDITAEIRDGLDACVSIMDNVEKGVYPKIYSDEQMIGRKITYEHCIEIIDKHISKKEQNK